MKLRLLLILSLAIAALKVDAQHHEELPMEIYNRAEQSYDIGQFDEARSLLNAHIKDFSENLLQSAYRLLALCELADDHPEHAEEHVHKLLDLNPYYSTTLGDPQRFTDMVERIRSGMEATITTASSQAESLSEVPVPITLITEEMIKNSGARNLQELLAAYVPGMNIIDCNDDINISMRGIFGNGQEMILIMLNGHRLNSYSTNIAAPDFSIGLDKLKQIEVLRGPASSLYGNVALTAVVNLITKQGADIDGLQAKAGGGNHGQFFGGLMLGKRYFDIDLLVWGNFYLAKGERRFVGKEDTGMGTVLGHDGYVTIGGIGSKPSYDIGAALKYRKIEFLYNTHFSQVQSPMTMTYLHSPYDINRYKTYNGAWPGFTTSSHHAHLSYSEHLSNVYLRGIVNYDNSDMAHYQVLSDWPIPGFADMLPLPNLSRQMITDTIGGFSRYISGQEHTFGGKMQGDWNYLDSKDHKGLISFGAEYSYYQLDDTRYTFGYDFTNNLPETKNVAELGKGHENSANAYLQLKHQWKSLIVNAGLRFDYKNKYDNTKIKEFSPRLALIYLQPRWNAKLSYSKAFVDAPYFYRKTNIFLLALMNVNPEGLSDDIEPISLHSYQLTLGATQWIKGLNMEVNAFYNKARNIISMGLLEHSNGGTSDIYGIEFSGRYERPRFMANLAAAWQKAKDYHFREMPSERPFMLPEFSASLVMSWKATRHFSLHSHVAFASSQHTEYINLINYVRYQQAFAKVNQLLSQYYTGVQTPLPPSEVMPPDVYAKYVAAKETEESLLDQFYSTKDVKPYATIDLGARYSLGAMELTLDIHNLLNRKYAISGASTGLIPQRGRWLSASIAYKF
jgi:iron complex outermembrane receptor protein